MFSSIRRRAAQAKNSKVLLRWSGAASIDVSPRRGESMLTASSAEVRRRRRRLVRIGLSVGPGRDCAVTPRIRTGEPKLLTGQVPEANCCLISLFFGFRLRLSPWLSRAARHYDIKVLLLGYRLALPFSIRLVAPIRLCPVLPWSSGRRGWRPSRGDTRFAVCIYRTLTKS